MDSVFNDSRCSSGHVCVWEGDALAAFTLTINDEVRSCTLPENAKFYKDTINEGLSIKLLNIMPYPIANQSIDPADYRVEISVAEN